MESFVDPNWQIIVIAGLALLVISCFFESNDSLRFFAKYTLFVVYSSIIATLLLPYLLISPKNVRNSATGAILLRHYTKLLGIEWDIRGTEELGKERGCVAVANHQSVFDILGMFNYWHIMGKCAAVAKNEVFYVFPFGPLAWLSGVVFISRNNGKKSMKKLNRASNLVTHDADGLQPFKKGAFIIAIENQVPILPIVYSPYYFIDEKTRFLGHGKIIVKTLEAIPTEGLSRESVNDLMAKTRSLMQEEFIKLTKEILATLPKDYSANAAQREKFKKLYDQTSTKAM